MSLRSTDGTAVSYAPPGRTTRLLTVLACLTAALALVAATFALATPQAAAKPAPKTGVIVSTDTQQIALEPFPCWKIILTVNLENPTSQGVFADAWIDPTGPVEVSRTLISTYVPAGGVVHAPVTVWIPKGTAPGSWPVTVHNERSSSVVTATAASVDTGGNLARSAVVTASSEHAGMPACHTADGNTDSNIWQQTAWFDSNARVFPDWVAYDFGAPTPVSRVEVYMLDSARYPAATFALSAYDVQAQVDGAWVTVASVRDNVAGHVVTTFPTVDTQAIRILCLGANDNFYSRIVETEIFS